MQAKAAKSADEKTDQKRPAGVRSQQDNPYRVVGNAAMARKPVRCRWCSTVGHHCGARKVFAFSSMTDQRTGLTPDRSAGRLWLLRIGLALLRQVSQRLGLVGEPLDQIGQSPSPSSWACLESTASEPAASPSGHGADALVPMTGRPNRPWPCTWRTPWPQTRRSAVILDDHGARPPWRRSRSFAGLSGSTNSTASSLSSVLLRAQLEEDPRWKTPAVGMQDYMAPSRPRCAAVDFANGQRHGL